MGKGVYRGALEGGGMKQVSIWEVAQEMGGISEENAYVSGYQIDSRKVRPGDLFFALKGARVDGHAYLAEVKAKGGCGAVVERGYEGPDFGLPLIRVEGVEKTLQEMAKRAVFKRKTRIVGITGSIGKTTTKDFAATLLQGKWRTGKNEGSCNTRLTLPLTLLNASGDEEVFVLEMGMSEPGDLKRLIEIATPEVAVVTKLALSHGAAFSDGLEGIAREKGTIFEKLETRVAIFDHALIERFGLLPKVRVTFSLEDRNADYFLSIIDDRLCVDEWGVRAHQFDFPMRQTQFLHNFLASIAVARALDVQWEEIERQVPFLKAPSMRFEQFIKEEVRFINDAYNANPESMRAALMNLPDPVQGGKKIAVLATMEELGVFSEEAHREVGRFAQKYVDHLIVVGNEATPLFEAFQEVKKPAEHYPDRKSAAARLKELMSPGDVVLVKGSRRMEMERIFNECS